MKINHITNHWFAASTLKTTAEMWVHSEEDKVGLLSEQTTQVDGNYFSESKSD